MNDIYPYSAPPLPGEQRRVSFDQEEPTDLRNYWFVIYRHRRVARIFFFLTLFLVVISIPWGDSLYTATSTVYIPGQTRGMFDASEHVNPRNNYQETQRKLLRSRSLVAQIIRDLGLETNPNFNQVQESPLSWATKQLSHVPRSTVNWVAGSALAKWIREYLGIIPEEKPKTKEYELGVDPTKIDKYLQALTVTPIPESDLVQVQFSSSDPALSKTVVNSHVATFISRNLATRFELTAETRQFLENKLVELKANVENSEKALNQFQRAHEIVSLDKGGGLLLDQLKKLNSDLTEVRSKRIELESLHHIVQKRDNRLLSQIIDNPTIQKLRNQITTLETQLAHLATKFKPSFPGVIALQQEIDEAKSRLEQELNRIVQTIEKDYRAAMAKESALAAETQKARQVALNLQENAVDYAVLDREVTSNRALYEAVFKKTKEAALTGEEPIPNLRVVDRAEIPVLADTPKWVRTLILGMAVSLLGAIGLAFLLHAVDTGLRSPDDVARFIQLPTLGEVVDVKKLANGRGDALGYTKKISTHHGPGGDQRGNSNQLVVLSNPRSLVGEMYRSIATTILFSRAEKPPQTILITSAQPDEGKTVTALNLAITLAQGGAPVLLIDADLHGGKCHKLLALENGNGLTNVLTGHANADRLIKKTAVNNLSLLSAGITAPNPANLLGSDKMTQTLDALVKDFRFIVVDSAPVLSVSDTVLLSTKVDGVILVVRGQEVSRNLVRKARERLHYVNANILGVVLNGIDIWSPEYGEYRHVYKSHYARYSGNGDGEFTNGVATTMRPSEDEQTAQYSKDDSAATISAELLDRLIAKFAEFAGPMASDIVRDQIAAMGESRDAFPQTRLEELIEAITREILNETMRSSFRAQISDEMRSDKLV